MNEFYEFVNFVISFLPLVSHKVLYDFALVSFFVLRISQPHAEAIVDLGSKV